MAANLGKRSGVRGAVLTLILAALVGAGCSSGGTQFTLFPQRETLTHSAKALRAASGPHPLAIPRELDQRLLPPYVVEPGDVLLVQPADLDSPVQLPGDQQVLLDGTIHLGRYGQLIVAGKTVAQLEQMVRAVIQVQVKDVGPITVRVVTRNSKVYYVLGEVNAPGAFPLQGRESVLDGIIAAGGLTDRASRRNIILSRPTGPNQCRIVLPVCYRDIVQAGDTTTNYQLAPGDRIFVPGRTLFEDLLPRKKECPPCGGPHAPCDHAGHAGPDAHQAPAPTEMIVPPAGPAAPSTGPALGAVVPTGGKAAVSGGRVLPAGGAVATTSSRPAPPPEARYPAYGKPVQNPVPLPYTEGFLQKTTLLAPAGSR